ncbi:MAG: YicC/YloC family endoribonuclease [Syntrophaceae bacterium]
MIKSMTGYGRAEAIINDKNVSIEIKSLNHRFLEIFVRLPGVFSPLEPEVKRKVTDRFARGRIEISIRRDADQSANSEGRLELNMPLIRNYYGMLSALKQEFQLKDEINLGLLLGIKDAVTVAETEIDLAQVWGSLQAVLEEAMDNLENMRAQEGGIIGKDLQDRLGLLDSFLMRIKDKSPQVVSEYQKRLSERVKDLMGNFPVDDARLAQEVAIMAERSDITEEIVRFQSHLIQMDSIMRSNEAIGRKIDFLLQEMNREANTIGSKSPDAEISQIVVDIKTELSRLREQIQNIE